MAPLRVARISAAVWKWFCRCPDAIGPEHDISSDEEFYTPPTSPLRVADEQPTPSVPASTADSMFRKLQVPGPLSPA